MLNLTDHIRSLPGVTLLPEWHEGAIDVPSRRVLTSGDLGLERRLITRKDTERGRDVEIPLGGDCVKVMVCS